MIVASIFVHVLFNCTNEVDYDRLIKRNDIYYETNSENPFSGKSVKSYENGQQKFIAEFKNGKQHGTYKKWYENGQQQDISEWEDGERVK